VPRRSLRLRVGGLVLAVEAKRTTAALDPPKALVPFLVARGGDIRLRLTFEPPPLPGRVVPLFDSGGVWRAERTASGLLYSFRIPNRRPPLYKVLAIDEGLREGTLHFDARDQGPRYALDFPLDELLFQHRLAREGSAEVHGCAVVWNGKALVFCGQSGAGKSTTARLWKRHARGARLLSDDRVVLRPGRGGRVLAYGTPWHGDGGFALPGAAPLGSLFFLRHGRATRLTRLAEAEAAARLFARSFPPPWDPLGVQGALDACAAAASVPAFDLAFTPDASAVEAIKAVKGVRS
jgi:hypothetical protein